MVADVRKLRDRAAKEGVMMNYYESILMRVFSFYMNTL